MDDKNGSFRPRASPLSHALVKVITTLISCLALKELVRFRIVLKLGEENIERSVNKTTTNANTLSSGIISLKVNASALWTRFHSIASATYCVVEKPCQVVIFDTREGQLVNWSEFFLVITSWRASAVKRINHVSHQVSQHVSV